MKDVPAKVMACVKALRLVIRRGESQSMGVQVREGGTPMELARISSVVSALYFVGRADVTGVTLHLKYLPDCCEEGEWVQEGEGTCWETSSEGEVVVQAGVMILVGALALVLKENGWSQDVFRGRIIGAKLAGNGRKTEASS